MWHSHLNVWKFLKQKVLFPKGLNWVQHWVSRIGLLKFYKCNLRVHLLFSDSKTMATLVKVLEIYTCKVWPGIAWQVHDILLCNHALNIRWHLTLCTDSYIFSFTITCTIKWLNDVTVWPVQLLKHRNKEIFIKCIQIRWGFLILLNRYFENGKL